MSLQADLDVLAILYDMLSMAGIKQDRCVVVWLV